MCIVQFGRVVSQDSLCNPRRTNESVETLTQSQLFVNEMSRLMGKPTICICENKGADQLRSNCEADQHLCFRYTDRTIPLLPKYENSSFLLFSVLVQAGLCRTCSKTTLLVFPRGGSDGYSVFMNCSMAMSKATLTEFLEFLSPK